MSEIAEQSWEDFYEEIKGSTIGGEMQNYISGDFDDPDNVRNPLQVLDSMIHAHGDVPYLNFVENWQLYDMFWDPYTITSDAPHYKPLAEIEEWSELGYDPTNWVDYFVDEINDWYYGADAQVHVLKKHGLWGVVTEAAHFLQENDPRYAAGRGEYGEYLRPNEWINGDPYSTPGALEHEAHEVIDPKMWDLMIKSTTRDPKIIAAIMNAQGDVIVDPKDIKFKTEKGIDLNQMIFETGTKMNLDEWNAFYYKMNESLGEELSERIWGQYSSWLILRSQSRGRGTRLESTDIYD